MFLGLESASKDTLLRMNKFSNGNKYEHYIQNAIKLLKLCFQYDVTPMLSFMLGYPGDIEKDLLVTIDFLNKIINLYEKYSNDKNAGLIIYPHIVAIIPRSPLFNQLDEYKKQGLTFTDGGLFKLTRLKNPSANLYHSIVLNYYNKAKMFSKVTPKMMDRMLRLMWCNFKELNERNKDKELIKDDIIITNKSYNTYKFELMVTQ